MKRLITFAIFAAVSSAAMAGEVCVEAHYRKDGTYVQAYCRSAPDSDFSNNYNSKYNINPNTGQAGTIDPYKAEQHRNAQQQQGIDPFTGRRKTRDIWGNN